MTYGLNLNLKGQTAAICFGYVFASISHVYFLLRSDWELLSEKAVEEHAAHEAEVHREDEPNPSSPNDDNDDSSCWSSSSPCSSETPVFDTLTC